MANPTARLAASPSRLPQRPPGLRGCRRLGCAAQPWRRRQRGRRRKKGGCLCESARRVSFRVLRRALHLSPPCHTPSTALCPPPTSMDGRPLLLKNIIHNLPGFVLLRQLIVVFGFFAVGAITKRNNKEGEGNTTFSIQNASRSSSTSVSVAPSSPPSLPPSHCRYWPWPSPSPS